MNKFEKHMAKGAKLILKNADGTEDEFDLKPLEYENLDMYYLLLERLSKLENNKDKKSEEETIKEAMEFLDKETVNLVKEICYLTMKVSYPDLDDKVAKSFVRSNMMSMLPVVLEANAL